MHLLSPAGAGILTGRGHFLGDGMKITAMSHHGQAKGHAMVVHPLRFHAVLFGTKRELRLADGRFFLGSLGQLKPGAVRTDLQSIVNFRLWQFLEDWVVAYLDQVHEEAKTADGIRRRLGVMEVEDPEEMEQLGWTLGAAARLGIDVAAIPALRRRFVRMALDQIDMKGKRLRIPIPESVAVRRYLGIDPRAFNQWGDLVRRDLPEGCWFPGGTPGEAVVLHRQPNGSEEEFSGLPVFEPDEELERYWASPFVFVSPQDIRYVCRILGGGDLDDPVVVYKGDRMHEHFCSLGFLPRVAQPQPAKREERSALADRWKARPEKFDDQFLRTMIRQMQLHQSRIGSVVNAVITAQVMKQAGIIEELPPCVVRMARSVEAVVDGAKMGGGNSDAESLLAEYRDWLVSVGRVPQFLYRQPGRLPAGTAKDIEPVRTQFDELLRRIGQLKREFERVEQENVAIYDPVPAPIRAFRVSSEAADLARQIRDFYRSQFREQMSRASQEAARLISEGMDRQAAMAWLEDQRRSIYRRAQLGTYARFHADPLVSEAFIELWREVYSRPLRLDDGTVTFPDGILWGVATVRGEDGQRLVVGTALLALSAWLLATGRAPIKLPTVQLPEAIQRAAATV